MDNLYNRTPGRCFTPVYVPGEQYSFYMNFDTPISDPDFANFRLDLYKDNVLASAGIGILQKDLVTGILYNIFSVFPFPTVPKGVYEFVIYDTVATVIKCKSNCILVESDPLEYAKAPLVLYRNESNIFGFNYESLYDYFNIFRLPLIKTDYQYELQKEQYRNASDDRLRNLRSRRFKYVQIESYYFDEVSHDAASAMYEHDGIYIDNIKYITKDAYQVLINPINDQLKGQVNAFVDDPTREYIFPINIRSVLITAPTTMALKTELHITDGLPVTVNWQTDFVPTTTLTYFQKHGNNPLIQEDDKVSIVGVDKYVPNGAPAYEEVRDPAFRTLLSILFNPAVTDAIYAIF